MTPIDKLSAPILRVIARSNLLVRTTSRKTRVLSAGALFLGACAFGAAGFAPDSYDADAPPVTEIVEALKLPDLTAQIDELEQRPHLYITEEKVRSGDTLSKLLQRLGVDDDEATSFIKSNELARAVMRLKPGTNVLVQTDEEGRLLQLSTSLNAKKDDDASNLVISREGADEHFTAVKVALNLERRVEMRSGTIRSSLFAATDAAAVPDAVAAQIVDMFSSSIDFASDLRRGDRFNVVFESFWHNGHLMRSGRILAAEFINAGVTNKAMWFEPPGGKLAGGYYSGDGKSLKKAFLKTPLAYTRISSGFAMRLHPISGLWKKHTGVDFAAPTGTPIRASGDGVVEFVGKQNGYGNIVVLKHWSNYSTAYGHMSAFASGLRKGERVTQGQLIGYVGSTGWATGPHLHYEFRISNQPQNPMTVDIPNATPLTTAQLQQFTLVGMDMNRRLALLQPPGDPSTRLARK
ncbi:peptidoglycan DD-metalloendopeptidase family protein [Herbaspirillum sp. RTI4]|uniref:M23 family metallopeptidase n=1 Tax=Herbaspirillum sp. RTI4 TaxID=3048640 RepID=UPI002AB59FCF|nr:peptidoglycan DD-metalloendopeptidase family protein [Herbaspirillum sp. RTI4]MDY7577540.1 peptidoglycan DD-metalloendopeptidase family protein [Herbaspirillum sp. RTI4]MEA9981015.1 peptidoglycan DD-metalloendopeptidase family protein [Herbaspirillum sp. RTI4]